MIAKIVGQLESIDGPSVFIQLAGGLTYEVLVPAFTAVRLAPMTGQSITLHTIYYIEAPMQGSTMTPRLAGFATLEDRDFFELFTTCKGIGNRKALRAMAIATAQIAAAIADRDASTLQSLPEIGKRTAETIIATLNGKVERYLSASGNQVDASRTNVPGMVPGDSASLPAPTRTMAREALEVLLQLGENRAQALSWIDMVLRKENRPKDVQDLVASVYRIKSGA